MSEYWKSTPKYWCKHCNTYVKDTPLERKQHENTGKHQGNLKRFLQGIQKDHVKNEREKDRAKAEVDRLNRVVGSHSSSAGVASTSRLPPSKILPSSNSLSVADQKRQWAQLAEMGIAVPDSARAEMAMAGDWQTISRRVEREGDVDDKGSHNESLNIGVKKRKIAEDEDEVEVEDNRNIIIRKGWGSTTKSYPEQSLQDLDALLSIPLKSKVKPEPPIEPTPNLKDQTGHVKPEPDGGIPESIDHASGEKSDSSPGELIHGNANNLVQVGSEVKFEPEHNNTIPTDTREEQKMTIPLFKKRKVRTVQS